MLRGPQTVSELRANGERFYRFEDASTVEAYLEELARPQQRRTRLQTSQTTRLPVNTAGHTCSVGNRVYQRNRRVRNASNCAALEERVARLEQEVSELREIIVQLGKA